MQQAPALLFISEPPLQPARHEQPHAGDGFRRYIAPRRAFTTSAAVGVERVSQSRVAGITFDVAVLSNLGRDHLDHHGDMQSYRADKESLFYHPQLRAAKVNVDDEFVLRKPIPKSHHLKRKTASTASPRNAKRFPAC